MYSLDIESIFASTIRRTNILKYKQLTLSAQLLLDVCGMPSANPQSTHAFLPGHIRQLYKPMADAAIMKGSGLDQKL